MIIETIYSYQIIVLFTKLIFGMTKYIISILYYIDPLLNKKDVQEKDEDKNEPSNYLNAFTKSLDKVLPLTNGFQFDPKEKTCTYIILMYQLIILF